MQTIIIDFSCLIAAVLPLLVVLFAISSTVPRKKTEVTRVLNKFRSGVIRSRSSSSATESSGESQNGGDTERRVNELFNQYFSAKTLVPPATLLTLLYMAGFQLCISFLEMAYFSPDSYPLFSLRFLLASPPVLYAFMGVYLFNLGAMIRRTYLSDLNEHVFWGGINRLLLTMGIATAFSRTVHLQHGAWGALFFFSIGFLANVLLEIALERGLRTIGANRKESRNDLPLRSIKGIDIWKEYRLEEEGIESVQNMATASLFELTVRTHYNARTLMDWIDQSIVLSRFSTEHVRIMSKNAISISAIDLAASSPLYRGDDTVSEALAELLHIDNTLMANTLNSLYEDTYVSELWSRWAEGETKEESKEEARPTHTPDFLGNAEKNAP